MDIVFPLNIIDATEDDYHMGKLTLIRNAQIRPKIVFDKKNSLIMVIYESPNVHILQNHCGYFLEYLQSLGNQKYKDLAVVLDYWKDLWTAKSLFKMSAGCRMISEPYNFESNCVIPMTLEEIHEVTTSHNQEKHISKKN